MEGVRRGSPCGTGEVTPGARLLVVTCASSTLLLGINILEVITHTLLLYTVSQRRPAPPKGPTDQRT